ncbi:MAG: SH3 domain-containing protein, partial [Chloroflexi bacterium]|nr:SH3 domain-containing protein [Chloroflexota bacterium]
LPPTPTPLEPTATPQAPTATATPEEPTPTPEPETPTPLPTPAIVANTGINVRSGPGTAYPVVAALDAGQSADIVGRSQNSAWWQITFADGAVGWVFADIVDAAGNTAAVTVISDISPPPATNTPSAPAVPTAAPKPAVDYALKSVRLRNVGEHAQKCDGGDHNIFVYVEDAAGNRLNGVRVHEIFTNDVFVSGDQGKGNGVAQYDIYRGGGGQIDIIDDAGNRISEVSRSMSADWPPIDLMYAAGYCNCKPHADEASCQADLESKRYFFAVGHYVYEVVFQRTY